MNKQDKMNPITYAGIKQVKKTPEEFIKASCEALNITTDILVLKCRKQHLVMIRAAIGRRMTEVYKDIPLTKIGKLIGKDHATIIYYRDKIPYSPELENNYNKILTLHNII